MVRNNTSRIMSMVVLLLVLISLSGCMDYTGFAVFDNGLSVNEDQTYTLTLDGESQVNSIKVSGEFEGEGAAFIYLDLGNEVKTIFNSELLESNDGNDTLIITFNDECVDTCDLDLVADELSISFIVQDAVVRIDSFDVDSELITTEVVEEDIDDEEIEEIVEDGSDEPVEEYVEDNEDVSVNESIEENNTIDYVTDVVNESVGEDVEELGDDETVDVVDVNETYENNLDAEVDETNNENNDSLVSDYTSSENETLVSEEEEDNLSNESLEETTEEISEPDNSMNISGNSSVLVEEAPPQNLSESLPPPIITNITVSGGNVSNEKTTYYRVMINNPVRWKKRIELEEETSNVKVLIPDTAEDIVVNEIENGEEKRVDNSKLKVDENPNIEDAGESNVITGNVVRDIQGNAFTDFVKSMFTGGITGLVTGDLIDEEVINVSLSDEDLIGLVIEEPVKEVEIEYYLPGPSSSEKEIDDNTKEVMISSDIHYENVLSFTYIKEVPVSAINLYWIKDGVKVRHDFEGYDSDNNGLIDYIEWVVPHLSNQTFEIELEILTVQSYPQVGGYWTTEFNTVGTADLEITGWDGTYFSEDIEHVALKCNGIELDAVYDGESVYYPNYYCDGTGEHIVQVLTEGEHTQKFDFGGVVAYAHNFASIVPNTINLQGKLENSSGDAISGNHNFTFKLYTVATGGSAEWTEDQTDVSVDANGIYDVVLGSVTPISLDFDSAYYLGIEVDDDGEMSPRINLTSTPYAQRAKFADTVECADCIDSTEIVNLSIVPNDLNYTGSPADETILTYESSGEIFEWHKLTDLLSSDMIGDNELNYSDVTLADFTNDAGYVTSGGVLSYYYNKTSTSYNGSLSAGGYVGYKAGNYICNQEFTGTHLCYESELILTIDNNNVSNMSQWSGSAWIITGGPKYSPATIPVNDCNGFTHGVATSYLGSFWMFDQTDGGSGGVGHCANEIPLACCKSGGAS